MYLISEDKVYSNIFDEKKKVYPEVKVVRTADNQLAIKVLDTGVESKPHYRQVATQTELFAKFGATAEPEVATADQAAQPEPEATATQPEPDQTAKPKAAKASK